MRRPARAAVASLLCALGLALRITSARANDPAAAESLFREALELMGRGDFDPACPKLEESQRLDPTGATALSLARCLESQGKTASAWARYHEALEFARQKGAHAREKEIAERIAAVASLVPRLVLEVPASVAALPGLQLARNDTPVGSGQWNSEIPVDPGVVHLSASAPGRVGWTFELTVRAGSTQHVPVPLLAELPAPPPSAVPASSAAPPIPSSSAAPPASPRAPEHPSGVARPPGYVALGTGVLGLGLGTYFLARRSTLADEAVAACATSTCGTEAHAVAVEKARQSAQAGTIAAVGFVTGGSLLAVGAFLLLRSNGSSAAMAPLLGPGTVGASAVGRF